MGLTLPFRRKAEPADAPMPRLYAIGDIHGRADLLDRMIGLIRADMLSRDPKSARIIVLGDFVDRGPHTAELVALLMRLKREPNVVVLKGNHEAAMVDALDGDHDALDLWLAHGGIETLKSFGLAVEETDLSDSYQLLRRARAAIPTAVRQWLKALPTWVRYGRYYFVHAGIRPGIPLDDQTDMSRLWITDEFTSSDADHGAVIVHGHTVCEEGVQIMPNRIGVDTGAYFTGRLSAVVLDEERVDVISTAL